MDKKFGPTWHVVVGEGYGFEITHEVKNLMYMFFAVNMAVCLWKCAWLSLVLIASPVSATRIQIGHVYILSKQSSFNF